MNRLLRTYLEWAARQKSVAEVVRVGYYFDETSLLNGAGTTHLAAAHYLESWGDARAYDGTVLPIQPMILPLFGGLTEIELIARIAGEKETDPYALVAATITGLAGAGAKTESVMAKFLHDGVLAGSAHRPTAVRYNTDAVRQALAAAQSNAARSSSASSSRIPAAANTLALLRPRVWCGFRQ